MRLSPRHLILPALLVSLLSCDETGGNSVDNLACQTITNTLFITALPATWDQPGAIADGGCVLARGSNAHRYKLVVDVTNGANMDLNVASAEFDTYMQVRTSGDNPLSADDNSGPGSNARVNFYFPKDTFYVMATSKGNGVTGAYTFTLSATNPLP